MNAGFLARAGHMLGRLVASMGYGPPGFRRSGCVHETLTTGQCTVDSTTGTIGHSDAAGAITASSPHGSITATATTGGITSTTGPVCNA